MFFHAHIIAALEGSICWLSGSLCVYCNCSTQSVRFKATYDSCKYRQCQWICLCAMPQGNWDRFFQRLFWMMIIYYVDICGENTIQNISMFGHISKFYKCNKSPMTEIWNKYAFIWTICVHYILKLQAKVLTLWI